MNTITKIFLSIQKHILFWGENYIGLPFIIALLIGAIYGVNFFTGRPITDDLGAIVGMMVNAIGIAITGTMVGLLQQFNFGYRSHKPNSKLCDDLHDSIIALLLFALFSYRIFS